MAATTPTKEHLIQQDIKRLHGLGYAQELFREMGGFSNFAISFTIISILTGGVSTYGFGLLYAGPLTASVGWPLVAIFVTLVGLSMAELASAYPTAGGLYYWASKLRGPGWGWFTGWFNLIGQVGVTASIDFGLAVLFDAWLAAKFPPLALAEASFSTTPIYLGRWWVITYAIILIIHCVMNVYGIRLVALLNDVSVWWHVVGVILVVGALILFAPHHSNAFAFLFSGADSSTLQGAGVPAWYGFLLGLLLAQYTLTGYDASAHVSEETVGAARRAPWGIVMSIVVSAIAGYILVVGLTLAIPDKPPAGTTGTGLAYIANQGTNAVQTLLGGLSVGWSDAAFVLFGLILIAQFFCGMSSVTANSRMIYAFSRDGAIPGSTIWHTLNKRRIPANAVWLAGGAAFVLCAPALFGNTVAFYALVSVGTVAIYIAYVLPTLVRLLSPDFTPGPWNLGRWSKPIGWVAVIWVAFISVLFLTPETFPISGSNFNYAPVVIGGCLILLTIWWLVSQRHVFKGPVIQGDEAQLERIEARIDRESVYHEPGVTAG